MIENKLLFNILVLRQKLKALFQKYRKPLICVFQFMAVALMMLGLEVSYDYTEVAYYVPILVGTAIVSAFLPLQFSFVATVLFVAWSLYHLSVDLLIFYLVIVLLAYFIVIRFEPRAAIVIAFTPLFLQWGLPFLMPILVGCFCSAGCIAALVFGVFFYYFAGYVETINVLLLSADGNSVIAVQKLLLLIGEDKEFYMMLFAIVLSAVVTHILYRSSFKFSWYIGMIGGGLTGLLGYFISGILLETKDHNVMKLFLGAIIAIFIVALMQFLQCLLDYSRTEKVQFEDEEYYYYVKAIPKISMAEEDISVLKINTRNKRKGIKKKKENNERVGR